MKNVYKKIYTSVKHLEVLNNVFCEKENYSSILDFYIYNSNLKAVENIIKDIGFDQQLYSQNDRQMKLADIIEYIFFSRGIFSLIKNNQIMNENIPKYIRLILHFVNLLMVYEIMTIDDTIRQKFINRLIDDINEINSEPDIKRLKNWKKNVGLAKKDEERGAPSDYFDTLLPKTAGGLWHEMLVFSFILRFDIGYIFPLLLHQKIFSRTKKLSPPDLIIYHKKKNTFYGIEIGNLKERQSGGFMAPTGIPVIPLDTLNSRISDRCPRCKKWIGICPMVIDNFSNFNIDIKRDELRCLYDCDKFTLKEKLSGKCPYMKYKDKYHNHYVCVKKRHYKNIVSEIKKKYKLNDQGFEKIKLEKNLPYENTNFRSKKIHYLKTHYPWYNELTGLF